MSKRELKPGIVLRQDYSKEFILLLEELPGAKTGNTTWRVLSSACGFINQEINDDPEHSYYQPPSKNHE